MTDEVKPPDPLKIIRKKRIKPKPGPKPGQPHAHYSAQAKADALILLNQKGPTETKKITGISTQTLYAWSKGEAIYDDTLEVLKEEKKALNSAIKDAIYVQLKELTDLEKAKAAAYGENVEAFDILLEKWRLLQDLPTSITVTQGMSDEESFDRFLKFATRVKQRITENDGAGEAGVQVINQLPAPASTVEPISK